MNDTTTLRRPLAWNVSSDDTHVLAAAEGTWTVDRCRDWPARISIAPTAPGSSVLTGLAWGGSLTEGRMLVDRLRPGGDDVMKPAAVQLGPAGFAYDGSRWTRKMTSGKNSELVIRIRDDRIEANYLGTSKLQKMASLMIPAGKSPPIRPDAFDAVVAHVLHILEARRAATGGQFARALK